MPDATGTRNQPVPAADHPDEAARSTATRPDPAGTDPAGYGERTTGPDPLATRVRATAPGLQPLVARATAVRRARERQLTGAEAAKARGAPRWTDVFTTQFTEFSNRPR